MKKNICKNLLSMLQSIVCRFRSLKKKHPRSTRPLFSYLCLIRTKDTLINFIDMKQEVIFLLLPEYADWEGAFLASSLHRGVMPGSEVKFVAKTVAPTPGEVYSLGGFRTVPDYTFDTLPADYAALILIGGMQWDSPEAGQVAPLVEQALENGKIVGAICNAASFMARHGFLNRVKHTGNTLPQLKLWGGPNYTNEAGYVEAQAVSDGGIVTANGSGYLEFMRELLLLLQADTPSRIQEAYDFHKHGLYR